MAHLWIEEGSGSAAVEPAWRLVPLTGARVRLAAGRGSPAAADGVADPGMLIRPDDAWVVVGSAAISINGLALHIGIRVLSDRDELLVGRRRLFFSTEVLAAVVPFVATERDVCCPRCKQMIEAGMAAVRCPQCGVWHHQSDELPCWLHTPHCALCPHPTALEAGYQWTPAEVGA